MSFSIGENVGRYRITEQLGQGGMATVYRAYDANLDRYVAIKVLHQAFKEDPNFLARFKREAQIVARLRHPHIVAVHEFDEHNHQPYLVMEFIQGETLKTHLSRKPYTLEDTVKLMTAVGDALAYAHEQGVLHRDIKPSNIILDEKGTPYLTDFGLARMVEAGESTLSKDMMLGTPQYISPEQAQGMKELGPATDIYSLGIVLYQLIVGRVPFSADTPYAIIHDHIFKPLPLPTQVNPNVPAAIERVLLKALAKEPADRFQSAREMAEALKTAVESSQVAGASPQRIQSSAIPASLRTPTPPAPVIPAAAPLTPSPLPVAAAQSRTKRRATLWMLGGLGAFVFTCLVGLCIAVAAITNPNLRADANALALLPLASPTPTLAEIPAVSVEEAQRMVAQNPDDPMAQLALAMALLESGNRTEGQQALSSAVQLAGDDPMLLTTAARQVAEQGYTAEALALYAQALRTSDETVLRSQAGQSMYEAACRANRREVLLLRRVAENNTDSAGAWAILGRAYIATGQLTQAEQAITTALEKDGTLPETHLILGELYAANGQQAEAEREWRYTLTAADVPAWVVDRANALLAGDAP